MKIKKITEIKPEPVYAIETTSGTYIANGLGHHNCRNCKRKFRFYVDSQAKSILSVKAKPIE